MDFNKMYKFSVFISVLIANVDAIQGVVCTRTMQCLTTFLESYPQENQENLLLSFPDEITYTCRPQNVSIHCDQDQGLHSCLNVQQALKARGMDATRYINFLQNHCPIYNTVFKNQAACVKTGLQSSGYLTCANGVTKKNHVPDNRVITSCPLYNGILGCVNNALSSCGQPAITYLIEGIKLRWTLPTSTCSTASARTSIDFFTLLAFILICFSVL